MLFNLLRHFFGICLLITLFLPIGFLLLYFIVATSNVRLKVITLCLKTQNTCNYCPL
jgi:hypothetical protein